MAARAVVISSNAGGLIEINVQNVTGFMADVGDIDAMSKYTIDLLQDEAKLATMKEAAYLHACTFDIKNIIPIYEKLYEQFFRV